MRSPDTSFLAELGRRKVTGTAVGYAMAAWIVVEVAGTVLPALGFPQVAVTFVVIAALSGFPFAVGLAWAFELRLETVEDGSRARMGPAAAGAIATVSSLLVLGALLLFVPLTAGDPPSSSPDPTIPVVPPPDEEVTAEAWRAELERAFALGDSGRTAKAEAILCAQALEYARDPDGTTETDEEEPQPAPEPRAGPELPAGYDRDVLLALVTSALPDGVSIVEFGETDQYGAAALPTSRLNPGDVRFNMLVEAADPSTLATYIAAIDAESLIRPSLSYARQLGRTRIEALLFGVYASFADPDTLVANPQNVDWESEIREEIAERGAPETTIDMGSCGTSRVITQREIFPLAAQAVTVLESIGMSAGLDMFSDLDRHAWLQARHEISGAGVGIFLRSERLSGFTWVTVVGAEASFAREVAGVVARGIALGRTDYDEVLELGAGGYLDLPGEVSRIDARLEGAPLHEAMSDIEEASGHLRIDIPPELASTTVSYVGARSPWPTVLRDVLQSAGLRGRFVEMSDSAVTVRITR